MDVHNSTIDEFMSSSKTVFVVPVYQRNYDWMDINCKQLFIDIQNCIKTGENHFLGTIFFQSSSSHEKEIIDGQQRITSLTLLLLALSEVTKNEDIHDEIRREYLVNKGYSIDTDYLKTKLHLNKQDDAVYQVLLHHSFDQCEDLLSIVQKSMPIYRNYKLFYKWVQDYLEHGGRETGILEAMDHLTIIMLEVQNENPQEIFESLNSTGMQLSNVDLLRNWFLMRFPHKVQSELYNNYWSSIEETIGTENMDSFFSDYLVFQKRSDAITIYGKREHINENNLYTAFKTHYSQIEGETDEDKTRECFADLFAYAKLYRNLVFGPDFNIGAVSDLRKKLYMLIAVSDAIKARPLLLYLLDLKKSGKITEDVLSQSVDIVASFSFRTRLCHGGSITRQFCGNVMQRLEEITDYTQFISYFWQAMTSGNGRYSFPSDDEFKKCLTENDIYKQLRSKGTKYLLYELEMNAPFPKSIQSFDTDNITVEHIMPQTLNTDWENELSREDKLSYESMVHDLGNLTLTNYNSEMSNRSFSEKKESYRNSGFYYTRQIAESENWSCDKIRQRGSALAEQAVRIWPLPADFQRANAVLVVHSLDEDTGNYAYKKPKTIQIGSQVIYVKYWADIIPAICKWMLQENRDAFEIVMKNNPSIFMNEETSKQHANPENFHQPVEGIYVRVLLSARSTLETIKTILNAYDSIEGTDIYHDFAFTLQ